MPGVVQREAPGRGLTANARVTSNGKKSPENMSDGELLDSHNAHVAEMKKRGIQPVKPPVDDDKETDNDDDAYTQPTTNAAEAPFVSRRLLEHLGKGRKASVANAVSGKAAKAETTGVSPALLKRLGKGSQRGAKVLGRATALWPPAATGSLFPVAAAPF